MSKKSLKRLAFWLSLLAAISVILSACGSPAQATPVPTAMPIPTMSKHEANISWNDYVFAADELTKVVGKPIDDDYNLVGLTIGDHQYVMKVKLMENTSGVNNYLLSIDLHEVNNDNENITPDGSIPCYLWNGHSTLLDKTWNDVGKHVKKEQISVFCTPDDQTLYAWFTTKVVIDAMAESLFNGTGTPASSGEVLTTPITVAVASITSTPLATNTPTIVSANTQQYSATLTALPTYVNGGSFDENGVYVIGNRASIGVDTNNPQLSFFFWKPGEAGTLYTTSTHAMFKEDDDPTHPMVQVDAVVANAHNKCWFENAALSNQFFSPCYKISIPASTISVAPSAGTVYYLYPMDHGHVTGGSETYQPHTPKPTSTPSAIPTASSTPSPIVTQNVILSTPVSTDSELSGTDCNAGTQTVTYQVNSDPDTSTCVRNLTNLESGTAHFQFGTTHYYMSFWVNTERLYAVYILNGFPANVVCTLNGEEFTDGAKTHNVRVSTGNVNSRVDCTANGKTFTAVAVP